MVNRIVVGGGEAGKIGKRGLPVIVSFGHVSEDRPSGPFPSGLKPNGHPHKDESGKGERCEGFSLNTYGPRFLGLIA
jgi:hypothetical protein